MTSERSASTKRSAASRSSSAGSTAGRPGTKQKTRPDATVVVESHSQVPEAASSATPERSADGPDSLHSGTREAHAACPVRSRGRLWLKIGVGAVIMGVLGIAVFAVGVYRFGWSGPFATRVSSALPFPVALAGSSVITFKEYRDDISTLEHYFASEGAATAQESKPQNEDIATTVMNRLIYDTVVGNLAERYGVSVTDEELERELSTIAEQSGSRENITTLLRSLYDWDEAQFKNKVLRPYLWVQKLETVLSENGTLEGDAKSRADVALKRVKDGESFEAVAKELSEDTSASVGGDLGFFAKGDMVPEFEAAVEALEPGQTSELVKTQYGYHVIQLVEKVQDSEKGQTYHARHILIRTKAIDEFINESLASSRVMILLPGYTWDEERQWAAPRNGEAS